MERGRWSLHEVQASLCDRRSVIMDVQAIGSWAGELQTIHAEGFKQGNGSSVGTFGYRESSFHRHELFAIFINEDDAYFSLFSPFKGVKLKLHSNEEGRVSEGEAHPADGVKHPDKTAFSTVHAARIIAELAQGDAHILLYVITNRVRSSCLSNLFWVTAGFTSDNYMN